MRYAVDKIKQKITKYHRALQTTYVLQTELCFVSKLYITVWSTLKYKLKLGK